MLTWLWIDGLLRRRSARVLGMTACVALAVWLVASLGGFIATSNANMTQRAARSVPVDWQVELSPGTDVTAAARTLGAARGVRIVRQVGYGAVSALTATTGATVQTTGAGKALGLPDDYAATFPGEIRYLTGAHNGVLLAQQTAANLHVAPGDAITLSLPGGRTASLKVGGVIDLPAADSLFQVVGAPAGSGATAPPDNIVVLPLAQWRALYAPVAAAYPDAVRTQLHVRIDHSLPAAPADAFTDVVTRANNVEAHFAGSARVGDNLAAILDAARADAIYSELLFLFLGLPGFVLAWMLAHVAAEAGHERRRSEQALLRIRGAGPGRIVALAVAEAALIGVAGAIVGLAATAVTHATVLAAPSAAIPGTTAVVWGAVATVLGLTLAGFAVVLPAQRDARLLTVHGAQARLTERRRPVWERLYIDVVLLAGAGVIYWQSMRDAYQVILVPEGVPTISINYLTLIAPIMLWAGVALLTWRISEMWLRRGGRGLARLFRPLAGRLSGVVTASMSRQRRLLSRGLVLVALAVSFAVSVSVFNTTYMQQARVDAELTNGADVAVTSGQTGLPADLLTRVRALTGVSDAEPMQHRLAYVGNDLQDIFGIDPATIGRATPMSDAFFQGGSAAQVLGRLASTPDGVLVSDETVKDFQLQLGDTMRLRLLGPDHAYHVIPFRYVGVAREFPTAPHDSFLVANASYVASATGVTGYETLLVRTDSSPRLVAGEVRSALGTGSGATVHDLQTELGTTLSSLTAIDLSGLTRLELAFAVIMAIAASGLMLGLGFAERKRTFAIAHALGATGRQLASFVWAEALFVAVGGVVTGLAGGWLEATVIVRILTGVFDPPPESLATPWAYLGVVGAALAASVAIAGIVAVVAARRPALRIIRDL